MAGLVKRRLPQTHMLLVQGVILDVYSRQNCFHVSGHSKTFTKKGVVAFLLTELNRALHNGFTHYELERYKQSLLCKLNNVAKAIDSTLSCILANEYVHHIVKGESIAGIDHYLAIGVNLYPSSL
jgi:zinc protease